ncbi:MAG: ATP-dependent protease LonB [Peptococcaceae bacterium]|nr:ATP-dependent protease LonB [Peptococcaceae bacterium]
MAILVQAVFLIVLIGLMFYAMSRPMGAVKSSAVPKTYQKEIEKMARLRSIALTQPLAEKTRPHTFAEVVGQEDGIKALRAALCGPNPQHVILYGPPGIGKTTAARLVMEEARRNPLSPFKENANFVEVDGTTCRFDERGIADPLIGSVHDPIYQGAGSMGAAGIPQPKPGAVTKAHGGILFIDEIGELHPIQLNKLLKIMEDRKVILESAYYSADDPAIPAHIHDIFQNGLPADFRLVGATTRRPEQLPPALRSRCIEIYFRGLTPEQIRKIAGDAARKMELAMEPDVLNIVSRYANSGRDSVNLIQMAASLLEEGTERKLKCRDLEWVLRSGQYEPRPETKIPAAPRLGCSNGLAVYGANLGMLLEIEADLLPAAEKPGKVQVTGIVEEEEMSQSQGHTVRRKSMALCSVNTVLAVLRRMLNRDFGEWDIYLNFPGGFPVDGPSAGTAMAAALYSVVTKTYLDNRLAMTGEVSLWGKVKPVGGVRAKIEAAAQAGATRVLIPRENWQSEYEGFSQIKVIPVDTLQEVLELAALKEETAVRTAALTEEAGASFRKPAVAAAPLIGEAEAPGAPGSEEMKGRPVSGEETGESRRQAEEKAKPAPAENTVSAGKQKGSSQGEETPFIL